MVLKNPVFYLKLGKSWKDINGLKLSSYNSKFNSRYTSTHSGALKWRFLTLAFIPGLNVVALTANTVITEERPPLSRERKKPHGRRSLDPDTKAERASGVLGIQGIPRPISSLSEASGTPRTPLRNLGVMRA